MPRNILLASFLSMLFLSLFVFLKRESQVSFETIPLEQKPYVTLHEFKYRKYSNKQVVKYLEGNKASLATINIIELTGRVKGWRYTGKGNTQREDVESSFVHANLNSQDLEDFQRIVEIKDALLGGGVSIKRENLVIFTQEASYLGAKKNAIVGEKPVHATLNGQFIDASKGFHLDLGNEAIELFGTVKGVIHPREKN